MEALLQFDWWQREGQAGKMERYRTVRAYSAGGVVFRLVPIRSQTENNAVRSKQNLERGVDAPEDGLYVEVVLVGRSHAGIWTLPKGTPHEGENIEHVELREVQEETGLIVCLIIYIISICFYIVRF